MNPLEINCELQKLFSLNQDQQDHFIQELEQSLKFKIIDFLQYDKEALFFHLYRVDVSEFIVEQCLQSKDIDTQALMLAKAIIKRTLNKLSLFRKA
ncbi:MAG: hypothetical protein H6620_10640 [Halobacteriovoraceae bacterium]|nr:hypothetical protein [Halobacteriovoraceae bacterium]